VGNCKFSQAGSSLDLLHHVPMWFRTPTPASRSARREYFGQQPPCLSPEVCAVIHDPVVQPRRIKSVYEMSDPTLAILTVQIWIWPMWTRHVAGPSSGVWMSVQMDKNSCRVTVKAGFYDSGFVSSAWAFCHVMFAQKVTYQKDLYCHVLYT